MIKLLLVEDDINISYIIKNTLEKMIGGYEVFTAFNGEEGLACFKSFCPDIIVSDIEMPVMNGLEMVKKIRQTNKDVPIIFATCKTESAEVVSGYDSGVNNYIKKPFMPEELDAHIKALLNMKNSHVMQTGKSVYEIGKYVFDAKNFLLIYDSEKRKLTSRESQLMELLLKNKGELVKRNDILLKFWGTDNSYASQSLNVFLSKLRSYLSHDNSVSIKSIKGVGLVLDD